MSSEKKDNFIVKLFQILKDDEYNKIISWNNNGTEIIIYNRAAFSSVILPQISTHNNYESFIRLLNMYGFNKLQNIFISEHDQFFHKDFRKDKTKKEIRNIKRKRKRKRPNTTNKNDEINYYNNLIQNGNLNSSSKRDILDFLIKQFKEINNFFNETKKKVAEINSKNTDELNKGINNNNDNNILNNSIENDNNNINNNDDNLIIFNNIGFSLNFNPSLDSNNIFQNESIKIDNENDNYSGVFDNRKNIFDS